MRQLKFRAWDKISKKMIQPHGGDFIGWHSMLNWEECLDVMQFTGLQDKNGRDIYEGDIVKCGYGIAKVVYHLGCWMVQWLDDVEANMELLGLNKTFRRGREDSEAFEIIGNIYENTELLA